MSPTHNRSLLALLAGGLLATPGLAAAQSEPVQPAPTQAEPAPEVTVQVVPAEGDSAQPGAAQPNIQIDVTINNTPAAANPAEPGYTPPPTSSGPPALDPITFSLTGAWAERTKSELDGRADYEVSTFVFEPRVIWAPNRETAWTFSASYGLDEYRFSGSGGLGGLDPWGDITNLSFTALLRTKLSDNWSFIGGPSIRFTAEEGSNLYDGFSGGGFAGLSYRVNDRITIGPGVGVFSEIEGSVQVFPILIVNWELGNNLSLRTGGGTGASRGPGLELVWDRRDKIEFAVGARYDSDRFRLDDVGVAPDGVGEVEGFSLVGRVRWKPTPTVDLSAFGGVRFQSTLRLEDQNGNELFDEDVDPQPIFGLSATIRF